MAGDLRLGGDLLTYDDPDQRRRDRLSVCERRTRHLPAALGLYYLHAARRFAA
jgi:regulator of sirC expression with transglutaminase-like and TPR domain